MSQRNKIRIVAVDGPAGSGKSSVCSAVAQKLGWNYVNTGAIYRAVGLVLSELGVSLNDEITVVDHIDAITTGLRWDPKTQALFYGMQDLTARLGSVEASRAASKIAKMSELRRKLLDIQRSWALNSQKGAIVDGRDIGTVIFPDADLKIFLTASLEERARRRLHQLDRQGEGKSSDLEHIRKEIAARDGQDETRDSAPLKKADDAFELDTTGKSQQMVIDAIIEILEEKGIL